MAMSLFRIPIRGWRKCVHEAAAFDSKGEYAAAVLLDDAAIITWWLRNDPPDLRIPTPIGFFEPDFVYCARQGGQQIFVVLEVKSDIFWDGEGSEARVKAGAACEWVRAMNEAGSDIRWDFAVVMDQDALKAPSLEALLRIALVHMPENSRT